MSTCYDCAYSKIMNYGTSRMFACGICSKYFCVPFSYHTPDICDKFRVRSGYAAWDLLKPEEREKYFEIYRNSPSYNPEVTIEIFFDGMDSGFLGIYPKGESDECKTD